MYGDQFGEFVCRYWGWKGSFYLSLKSRNSRGCIGHFFEMWRARIQPTAMLRTQEMLLHILRLFGLKPHRCDWRFQQKVGWVRGPGNLHRVVWEVWFGGLFGGRRGVGGVGISSGVGGHEDPFHHVGMEVFWCQTSLRRKHGKRNIFMQNCVILKSHSWISMASTISKNFASGIFSHLLHLCFTVLNIVLKFLVNTMLILLSCYRNNEKERNKT